MQMLTIHRLDNNTRIRLAEIERDRTVEIARLEGNGMLFRSAHAELCPRRTPELLRYPASRSCRCPPNLY